MTFLLSFFFGAIQDFFPDARRFSLPFFFFSSTGDSPSFSLLSERSLHFLFCEWKRRFLTRPFSFFPPPGEQEYLWRGGPSLFFSESRTFSSFPFFSAAKKKKCCRSFFFFDKGGRLLFSLFPSPELFPDARSFFRVGSE